uniref:Uncharacterized protein n=1 Tax=Tanacetum cinerariifolium TaxID=118510 RepID=A0A699GRT8_TANCI|nr:hypothetical protein [Tanacetum cinerariifolium]GEW00025.1 hypothetical protein [Tanacetum cinerariifolium]
MDDPDITMEEYVQLETKRALRNGKVYNWETTTYGKIWYDEDVHYLRFFEIEFSAIINNDALTSKSDLSSKPTCLPGDNPKCIYNFVIESVFPVIIEQRVKVDQKARILELKRENHEEHYYDILYVVSIKEDMAYMCLASHGILLNTIIMEPTPRNPNTSY